MWSLLDLQNKLAKNVADTTFKGNQELAKDILFLVILVLITMKSMPKLRAMFMVLELIKAFLY